MAGALPSFHFDAKRLSAADRTSGAATLVVLIGLFLPWFGLRAFFIDVHVSGVTAHGWLYLVFLVALAVLVQLVAKAGWDKPPVALPVKHDQLLLVGTIANLVLVAIAFLAKPGGSAVGWSWGAVVTLVAAVVAASPYLRTLRSRAGR